MAFLGDGDGCIKSGRDAEANTRYPAARFANGKHPMPANSNLLYLVIGALVVVVAVLGYNLYQDRKEPKGVQLNIGPAGVSVEKK
jgi:predicted negative regulator of RcsB-dependent stress response